MSTDPDKDTACPQADIVVPGTALDEGDTCPEVSEKKRRKASRSVCFPDEDQLVTQYFEPANPWHDVPNTTRAQLAAEYLESCRRHNTTPIDSVLQQIRELPENSIGGGNRAARLTLTECSLAGVAPADALEALLRKVQFRRLEIQYCELDDEGAEALFDMVEYYESAQAVCISGPRQFGIRGWQAACRMIKKSAELSEVSLCESALCASHAPVLVRALRPHTCRLRSLCLQRAELRGEPLLCLVIALKSNTSIRELRLPDNQLSVSDAQQLASLLKLNLHIQLLDLSNNDIQDAGTGHIADALVEQAAQTPPSAATSPLSPLHCLSVGRETRLGLAFLVLWNNQLTRNCAPHLTKALRSSQSLCVLNIGRNALGADTIRALQCGSCLVSLGLQSARLGPGAARPLADLLRADTKLQRLDLRDNRLGVAGLQAILNAMQENTTLTQIDLDDPAESSTLSAEESEAATIARLTREIGALCRRNEPHATEPERRVHRKISLTCHTAFSVKPTPRAPEAGRSRTARLRSPAPSPAPSPAGSPVPHAPHNSRFNVTRVTPDRESSTESSSSPVGARPAYCLTPSPSRFKVVQVAEPPQIQIHPASKKRSSRFSVTRNYDAMYNPSPPSVSPTPSIDSPGYSPSPSVSPVPSSPSVTGSPVPSSPSVTGSPVLGSNVPSSPGVIGSPVPSSNVPSSPSVIGTHVPSLHSVSGPPIPSSPVPSSPSVIGTHVPSSHSITGSPVPISHVPSSTSASGSPTVMNDPVKVISSSPTVMNDSVKVISGSPTVLSDASLVISESLKSSDSSLLTGSPTVISTSPKTTDSSVMMTGLPTMISGSPKISDLSGLTLRSSTTITESPTKVTDSPNLISESLISTGTPTIMTVLPTVPSSPKVTTYPRTVISESPIVTTGSPKDTVTHSLITGLSIDPELPLPMTVSPILMTCSPKVTEPSTIFTESPAVISSSPKVTSSIVIGSTVISTSPTLLTDLSTMSGPNRTSPISSVSPLVFSESLSLRKTGSQTAGVITDAMTDLTNVFQMSQISANVVSTKSISTEPSLGQSCILANVPTSLNVSTDSISYVTSGVKASMSPSLAAVPIVSQMAHFENPNDEIKKTEIAKTKDGLSQERDEIIEHKAVVKTDKEADLKNKAEFDDVNMVERETSDDTLTGTIISKSSDTLSGTINETLIDNDYRNVERIESLTNVTDFEHWPNVGQLSDISQFEPTFGTTVIPKNVLEPRAVPNSRFSISPLPDNFGIFHESNKVKDMAKPVAIGSQSNLTATDNKPVNIEADILTVLAEITEKVEPKVVEPIALPDSVDLEKHKNEDMLEIITSENRAMVRPEDVAITVITDVSSNTGIMEKSIDLDKPVTKISEEIMCKESLPKSTDVSNVTNIAKAEEGPCINIKSIADDSKNQELVKIDLKSILKDEVSRTEMKPELLNASKSVDIIAADITSTQKAVTPHKSITDSDKISETKTGECVKNKTYSDALKSDPKYIDKSEQLTHKEEISDSVVKTETKLVKNSIKVCDSDKLDVQIEITVKKESVQAKVHSDQNKDFVNVDDIIIKKEPRTMKQIEAITEDLGNLIQEMKDMSSKSRKGKSDCTVDIVSIETNTVPGNFNRDVVLKKNKSESSLDSPDLEVSRLMTKKLVGSPFCDSSSSLEVSGSSMESLNATESHHHTCHVIPKHVVIQESVESDTELDRRKDIAISMGSSVESTSDVTPVNPGHYLNTSLSSNESVSPIIFGKKKKIHDSLSSLEASMSSLDSGRQEKVMVTSADSGIEYSLQHPSENKEDNSSNEGTLTHNSSLRETVKKADQETLTSSPKRTSSLLDVPALKSKGLDRMRKISWVAPSSSFHVPKVETEKFEKPSHLEKLLSLFQHPTSLFSRSQSDEEKKSASNTPPRKDSSLTSSFWSWGSAIEKEDKEDSSEATDSTLSERVQVSFVDESFSKKLDSKTPSTDTDNTLSEFQSFPTQTSVEKVTDTTDEDLVQKCLGLSLTDKAGSNGNSQKASDTTDLSKPNDLNRNYDVTAVDEKTNKVVIDKDDKDEAKVEAIRPRSFAAVLKSSGSENYLDKQPSPDSGQPVDKLPSKVIRGIKENISPENTLISSMTNTKTLVLELAERQVKNQPIVNTMWEVPISDKSELKTDEVKIHSDLAPIATIDETSDEAADNTVNVKLEFIDDVKTDDREIIDVDTLNREEVTSESTERKSDLKKETAILDSTKERRSNLRRERVHSEDSKLRSSDLKQEEVILERDEETEISKELENVDLGKDALSYLIYESQDFETETEHAVSTQVEGSLAQELIEAEIKEMLDLSPELILDDAMESEVFSAEIKKSSPVIPERAKLIKSNSLEDLSQREETTKSSPKTKTIAFKVPETQPRDIPRRKLRTMSGSSPKSLPESLNKPCPLAKLDTTKKRKKVSSLGKMAKDSLLALNMSEDEIAEYRRSYATSAESLRSLESVSEDANSQSGTSVDSRCRACLRTSQESLMSLDSITEDCKCGSECERGRSVR